MPTLVIAGTVIDFPNDAQSPDWSPGVVAFAVAVTSALSGIIGPYDIVPQQVNLTPIPNNVTTPITNLSFSTSQVISAEIHYAIYRHTSSTTLSEAGVLTVVYNATNSPGSLWEMTRETDSDANVIFTISDTGQVNINTGVMSGTGYSGYISFYAHALQVNYT